jgi:hypothetical protein
LSVDIMFPNLEEGRALTGVQSPEDVLKVLREEYPQTLICLKLDKDGAMVADSSGVFSVEATRDTVVDATGAGDSFCGAFLGHYLRSKDAKAAAELAAQVAGWVVSVFGARPEPDQRLEARLKEFGFVLGFAWRCRTAFLHPSCMSKPRAHPDGTTPERQPRQFFWLPREPRPHGFQTQSSRHRFCKALLYRLDVP